MSLSAKKKRTTTKNGMRTAGVLQSMGVLRPHPEGLALQHWPVLVNNSPMHGPLHGQLRNPHGTNSGNELDHHLKCSILILTLTLTPTWYPSLANGVPSAVRCA